MDKQVAALVPDHAKVAKGTRLIKEGWLGQLRAATGISRNHLARLLGSHGNHLQRWESGKPLDEGGVKWVHYASAIKVADLADSFRDACNWLRLDGLQWEELVPLRVAAANLGISTSTLRVRLGQVGTEPIDLGLLGEWITKQEMAQCRR